MGIQERTGHLNGSGGLKLYYRIWVPDQPKGGLVLVHGVNEHIGRYEHVAAYFAQHGYAVFGLDQRGFGRSEGTRCFVNRFEEYVADMHTFVTTVAQEYGTPDMVGHSMGGLVAFRYAVAHPDTIRKLVLSSPFFGVKAQLPAVQKALAPLVSALLPRLQMSSNIPPGHISRSPDVVKAYAEDPLVWKKATPRWYAECMRAVAECHQGLAARLQPPVLILQAGDDLLVDPAATRAIYEQIAHQQKAFKLYPGKYHEIFNDPGHAAVLADVMDWLKDTPVHA